MGKDYIFIIDSKNKTGAEIDLSEDPGKNLSVWKDLKKEYKSGPHCDYGLFRKGEGVRDLSYSEFLEVITDGLKRE